jgi:hypothetical protein
MHPFIRPLRRRWWTAAAERCKYCNAWLSDEQDVLIFETCPIPMFFLPSTAIICSRTFSQEDVTPESLVIQARSDTNALNRVEAFRR